MLLQVIFVRFLFMFINDVIGVDMSLSIHAAVILFLRVFLQVWYWLIK